MGKAAHWRKQGAVAVLAMEEREGRNTFTRRLIADLMAAFDEIGRDQSVRAVVIHGYDAYFCCGGTRDELLGIYEGRVSFADLPFYDLPLRCEIPVVAAMQGHALGGGLAFGCYADLLVMGDSCVYSANFMKYGFTPGMGATLIVPHRLGALLGGEMLWTARSYRGAELAQRGAPATIVKKDRVIETAMDLARELADKPRVALTALKAELARELKERLPATIARELAMHETTFSQPEVRRRIESLFGE